MAGSSLVCHDAWLSLIPESSCTRRLGRKFLRQSKAVKARAHQKPVKAVPVTGFRGQTCHHGTDEIRQTLGFLWIAGSNVVADHILGRIMEDTSSFACSPIIAAGPFQYETAGGVGICGVMAGGFLQHCSKSLCDRTIRTQKFWERYGTGSSVTVENACVEPRLAAEGGVEAGRVDAKRVSDVRDADGVVTARMEQTLSCGDRLRGVKATWPAAGA